MPQAFRTATPMADWRTFRFIAGTDTAGAVVGIRPAVQAGVTFLYLVGNSVGAVIESAAIGAVAVLAYHVEKIMVPKTIGDIFVVGQRVWWDPATGLVTVTQAKTNYLIGAATEPAAAADVYVEIDLDGGAALLGDELD